MVNSGLLGLRLPCRTHTPNFKPSRSHSSVRSRCHSPLEEHVLDNSSTSYSLSLIHISEPTRPRLI
eukprot:1894360-Amphidinium_carterae.1